MIRSKDRCPHCNVLLDKPGMRRVHRCIPKREFFRNRKWERKFIKQLVVTEVILIGYLVFVIVS